MNDQRRVKNQPSPLDPSYLVARDAAAFLDVKLRTLYAYASRGLLRTVKLDGERHKRYLKEDLVRLKARAEARSGHGPVAAAALNWGEPVLESAITEVRKEGPCYRGHPAVKLAEAGYPLEAIAELLWTTTLPPRHYRFPAPLPLFSQGSWFPPESALAVSLVSGAPRLTRLRLLITGLLVSPSGPSAGSDREEDLAKERTFARSLLLYAAGLGQAQPTVARSLLCSLHGDPGFVASAEEERALNMGLVLVADHELNVGTFAARVAASAGADLVSAIAAALHTFSGHRHGTASSRIEEQVRLAASSTREAASLRKRLLRGEEPGWFGHPLYPLGDPRARPLLRVAAALAPKRAHLVLSLAQALADNGQEPNVDLALVALTQALGLPFDAAASVFVSGRLAGWVAHIQEQRRVPQLLRPRARYIGP